MCSALKQQDISQSFDIYQMKNWPISHLNLSHSLVIHMITGFEYEMLTIIPLVFLFLSCFNFNSNHSSLMETE